MQRFHRHRSPQRKSPRHVAAANARWRAESARRDALAESDPVPPRIDMRQPFSLPLKYAGGVDWHIEPVPGKIAWKATCFETGEIRRAAIKTLLRGIADSMHRTISERSIHG